MPDQVSPITGSGAFKPPEAARPHLEQQDLGDGSNGLQFFGKDGLTFLDFLDVINPLQHIPIVSTLYQSISGDSIDPGAKIVGGTLFGGPLGAALSSLDVVIKHSTGRDIADHTVAFFVGTKDDQNTFAPSGKGLEVAALGPAQLHNRPNRGQAPVSELEYSETGLMSRTSEPFKPSPLKTQISEERFRAAGMFAIPIAKVPYGEDSQGPANNPRSLSDPGLLGDNARQTTPHNPKEETKIPSRRTFAARTLNNETGIVRQYQKIPFGPHQLKPKFSATDVSSGFSKKGQNQLSSRPSTVTSLPPTGQPLGTIQVMTRTPTDNQNNWIVDAMRQGLKKYENANSLARGSSKIPGVLVR